MGWFNFVMLLVQLWNSMIKKKIFKNDLTFDLYQPKTRRYLGVLFKETQKKSTSWKSLGQMEGKVGRQRQREAEQIKRKRMRYVGDGE